MGKESLKLFGTHAIISIFIFLFSTMILGGAKSEFVHWLFTVLYLALFWSVIWFSIARVGNNDVKRDRFAPWKGFLISFFVQLPALISYAILILMSEENWIWLPRILIRGWLSPYLKFAMLEGWKDTDWWVILFILLFIAVTGLGYLFGKKQREKTLKIIEEREQMRAELSKRDSE